ncbi:hypothetical protein B1L04_20820 [Microcystis aeruginosa KW]|uniref:Uncharacterized protein n=1 Tax=Microcystis aeruginosa KW TaxID=1960155 RepID=A0A1V4BLR5_MICAE|nr:hypothetical protein B1L04_20820 [Microcystis aeruginosa KW]
MSVKFLLLTPNLKLIGKNKSKKIVVERLKEDRKKSVTLNPNLVLDNFNMMLSLLPPELDNQVLIYVQIPKVLRIMCDCPTS